MVWTNDYGWRSPSKWAFSLGYVAEICVSSLSLQMGILPWGSVTAILFRLCLGIETAMVCVCIHTQVHCMFQIQFPWE